MDGLVPKSIQHFLSLTYGAEFWEKTITEVGAPTSGFEALGTYDATLILDVIEAAAKRLDREAAEIWEDLGTHLITHPDLQTVRRLLRFGGTDFEDFLWSLDDLYDRAQLAVQGMSLPEFRLTHPSNETYHLALKWPAMGPAAASITGPLVLGALRAMADDYGALVFLEQRDLGEGVALIEISLLEAAFAPGRDFHLAMEMSS